MASNIIFQWLERIGLSYSVPMFQAEGITSPQALLNLDFNSYDRLGIVDVDDRKRLFELVHRVREVSNWWCDCLLCSHIHVDEYAWVDWDPAT
jgi:hypothetical protein